MTKRLIHFTLIVVGLFVSFPPAATSQPREQWKILARGIEYGVFNVRQLPDVGNGIIHIVRIDPAQAKLKLALASEHNKQSRSTAQWCKDFNLVAAINAGMFYKDYLTNVGYLRNRSHIQNKRWNNKYKSALAFGPRKAGIPKAIMVDLDTPDSMKRLEDYDAVVQNLRLIKGNGVNVWSRVDKSWSESAVGMDREGRVIFVFCRSPLTMRDFNEAVRSLGLGVVRLMHMEGGPLASLSIRTKDIAINLAGSYETNFRPDDTNMHQWPIPNVIGVQGF
ncbi:MAG: hypothetical protein CVU61_13375 [Deltaproteobacteria bacterium HGW-Deltaproteobacteria-19]|jgi:hypothetical protein|nr:MAG: hypothetical protein CVU61_13375 [Deltaproteobacteria bacterium HGW-Deltaproteobacteria-19]